MHSLRVHAAQEAALEANEWDREVPLALQQVHKRVTDFDDEECDQIFLRQVTDKIADNYSDIIKQPMWLQQIGCAPHQRWRSNAKLNWRTCAASAPGSIACPWLALPPAAAAACLASPSTAVPLNHKQAPQCAQLPALVRGNARHLNQQATN